MPNNWTRSHDAWIAWECEGLEVREVAIYNGDTERFDQHGICLSHYLTDPAAAIRAAEAWRKKEAGRSYHTDSAVDDAFGSKPESACCRRNYHSILGTGEGPGALAQALYRVTGGPA